jgi:hypothetical protein
MRRLSVFVTALVLVLGPATVASASTQPDNGAVSSGRNANAVAGGPHCHIVEVNRGAGHFDNISAYPSHRAHVATGVPVGIFRGDADCDGEL